MPNTTAVISIEHSNFRTKVLDTDNLSKQLFLSSSTAVGRCVEPVMSSNVSVQVFFHPTNHYSIPARKMEE